MKLSVTAGGFALYKESDVIGQCSVTPAPKGADITSYNKIVVFIDRSPAECYNKFRMLWIGGTSPTAKTVFGRLQPQLLC